MKSMDEQRAEAKKRFQERCKKILPVIQAASEGKDIECRVEAEPWREYQFNTQDIWNNLSQENEYRVAPEKKYRPFTEAELLTQCGRGFKSKSGSGWYMSGYLRGITDGVVCHTTQPKSTDYWWMFLRSLFEHYVFEDGSPCGMPVEEASGS